MRPYKAAFLSLAIGSALAVHALCGASAVAHAFSGTAAMQELGASASPLAIEVRHRHRHGRYRRARSAPPSEEPAEPEKSGEPEPKPARQPAPPQASLPEAATAPPKPAEPMGPPPPKTWSAAEVEAGVADCGRRLSGLHVLYDKLEPIREGACGLPAPIRLEGFESARAPDLAFVPAPAISCKMTEALRRWFDVVVQPKAKAYLNAAIVRMRTVSDYDCRPRYDDPAQRISQHGFANALDIGEFITAKGERIAIEEAWNAGDERAAFLRDIHAGACEIFGTTLGPEANEAHRNHFHLDMTERRRPLCDFTPEQARARELAKKPIVPASTPAPLPPAVASAEPPLPAAEPAEPRGVSRRRHRRRR